METKNKTKKEMEFENAAAQLIEEYDALDKSEREELDNYNGGPDEIPFGVDRDEDGDLIVVLGNHDGYVWGSATRETLAEGIAGAADVL